MAPSAEILTSYAERTADANAGMKRFFQLFTPIDDLNRPSGYDKAIDTGWEYQIVLCVYYGDGGILKHNLRRRRTSVSMLSLITATDIVRPNV